MSLTRSLDIEGIGRLKTYPVAPGSTFVKGDWLTFDGSGRLQQIVAVSTNYGAGFLVGRANENALKDDGSLKPHAIVEVCEPGTRFKAPLYHSTPANALYNSNLVGSDFELRNSAGGFPVVDISQNTNKKCRIVDVDADSYPGYPDTTGAGTQQYPFVWFEILAGVCLLTGAR